MNKILRIVVVILFFGFADYGFKYPILHWIIFYFYTNTVIYLTIKTYIYSKITRIDIANLILILVFFVLLGYLSIKWLVDLSVYFYIIINVYCKYCSFTTEK